MTDHVSIRFYDVARQFFAREGWAARWDSPLPDYGLPAVHAHGQADPPFRASLGYLLLEVHHEGRSIQTGLLFRHDHRQPEAVGPLLQDEQEFLEWARREHPDRVAIIGDRWADARRVVLQAFQMPRWRQRHPDLAAEADNLRVLVELGA